MIREAASKKNYDMKVLFVSHLANFQKFNNPYIRWLKDNGCRVDYASYDDEIVETADNFFRIDFRRNPINVHNIFALFQLIRLMLREKYDVIHCHSPVGALLTRMASVFVPRTKIIYTAHGFHFYKGAPLKNILVYKTAEKLLARRTDVLVTINNEDYAAAQSFRLRKGGRLYQMDGVGVDTDAVESEARHRSCVRKELKISDDEFVVFTVAELIKRKNYETALRAFASSEASNARYVICGSGTELLKLKKLCTDLGISERVVFLGYRRDVYRLLGAADIFLFTSHQEGMPISVIEAMAAGLPCVASDIRGNNQLISGENGIMCRDDDVKGFADGISLLYRDKSLRQKMGEAGKRISKQYDIHIAVERMGRIYEKLFDDIMKMR